jgi:hypothetical protein
MKNLSCFGSYKSDNKQCVKCNDTDCQRIEDLKMNCQEQCRKDVTSCGLWDTSYCILYS